MDGIEASLVKEIIIFARENSAYHKQLYQSIQQNNLALEDIPIVSLEDYWKSARADYESVLTGPFVEGKAYCTGGLIDDLETAYLTKDEAQALSKAKAILWANTLGLPKGARIANVMKPCDLYVGFWEMINMFNGMYAPVANSKLLISSEKTLDGIIEEIEKFHPSVLFGSLYDIARLAEHLVKRHAALPSITTILYIGETTHRNIHSSLATSFPNSRLFGPLYDKIDLGPIGIPISIKPLKDRDVGQIYRVCKSVTILEILTDDGVVIKEPGVKGNVVITHLIRRLQPVIRHPVGDMAEWVNYESRVFKYHGRASAKIKLANTTLDWSTVKEIVSHVMGTDVRGRFQCVLRQERDRPKLILRLAYPRPRDAGELRHQIEKALWNTSLNWKLDRKAGLILGFRLEWVDVDQLDYDNDTGELRKIVDERGEEGA